MPRGDGPDDAQHKMLEEVKGSPPPDKEEGPYKAKEKGFLAKMKAQLPDQLYFMGDPLADKGMQWDKELPKALADAVNGLVAKYHDESAPGGRPHRFVVALHPTITNDKKEPR